MYTLSEYIVTSANDLHNRNVRIKTIIRTLKINITSHTTIHNNIQTIFSYKKLQWDKSTGLAQKGRFTCCERGKVEFINIYLFISDVYVFRAPLRTMFTTNMGSGAWTILITTITI